MKNLSRISSIFLLYLSISTPVSAKYEWAIIGAGPAGITTLAVLVESGVDPATIVWIDPQFTVGRMGKYYRNVPSNTKINQLKRYIQDCTLFAKFESSGKDALFACDPEGFYPLQTMVAPLADATDYLRSMITCLQDTAMRVDQDGQDWRITCTTNTITAHKVILAIGAHPKQLEYPLQAIPSDEAVDKEKLAQHVNEQDCIAVFGGMHSAMLALKYLSELGVKKIINFYTTQYFFRIPGAESLEGVTEFWVKNVLEKNPPQNLVRVENTPENIERYLPECNKVIYAIGYERNEILINGSNIYLFDEKTGTIAPNLYGIGIAFPHTITQRNNKKVAINGFSIFLHYAKKLVPEWKTA
jgi:thioredoxin reductase